MAYTILSLILERFVKKHDLKLHKHFIEEGGRQIYVPHGKGWTLGIDQPDENGHTIVTLQKIGYHTQDVRVPADPSTLEDVLERLLAQALERDRAGKDIEYSVYDEILDRVCARHGVKYYKLNHENEEIRTVSIEPVQETRAQPRRRLWLSPPDNQANTYVITDREGEDGKAISYPANLTTLETILDDCILAAKRDLGLI